MSAHGGLAWIRFLLFMVGIAVSVGMQAWAQKDACSLATADELQAALGTKVSGLKPQGMQRGSAQMCVGQTPTATVMLRRAQRSSAPGKEAAGIEAAKKMGAQVEVKTDGPITCSSMVPPKNLEQYGFNTTCSVFKNGQVAAIEVTAKSRANTVTVDALHKVAENMASWM